jgi:phosphatidylglycerol:prolipoprotein diacylglycerol transferase
VAGGFAGAWLTFVLVEAARTGTFAALARGGGLVFFGAVPGGVAGMRLAGRAFRLDVLRVLELSLPGLAAGHALGRVGCFLGGCCFGRPFEGPWAVTAVDPLAPAAHPPVPRHPVALYEAAGLLILGLAFARVPAAHPGSGRRAAAYLVAYGALRLGTEAFRGDAIRGVWAGGVSTSQGLASFAIVLGALLLWRASQGARSQRDRAAARPPG